MSIIIVTVTDDKDAYDERINAFIESLDEEKEYFKLDRQRYEKFLLTIVAVVGDEIVGIAGFEKKSILTRSLIMVKKDFQSDGLGKKLYLKLMDEANSTNISAVLGATSEENIRAKKLHYSTGFKFVGNKDNMNYYLKPVSYRGGVIYYLMRLMFPIMKALEFIRTL